MFRHRIIRLTVFFNLLTAITAHASTTELLRRACEIDLGDAASFEPLDKLAVLKDLEDLNKSDLSPEERKSLFRLIILEDIPTDEETINQILGLRYEEVSSSIHESLYRNPDRFGREPIWNRHRGMATLPFSEFHRLFRDVPVQIGQTVIDIGAGFGKLGIYLAIVHPGVKFIGYEIVPERVVEFNRIASALNFSPDVRMVEQNLADQNFKLELADWYYSWNPVNPFTGRKIWEDLAAKGLTHSFGYVYLGLPGGSPEEFGFVRVNKSICESSYKHANK